MTDERLAQIRELAKRIEELLKMLQATTVEAALEQLQAHFDKDKRLIENYTDMVKAANVERVKWEALAQERGKIISDIAEKAVARHRKWSLQQLNVESYAELIDDAACREFARGLIVRVESAEARASRAEQALKEAAAEYAELDRDHQAELAASVKLSVQVKKAESSLSTERERVIQAMAGWLRHDAGCAYWTRKPANYDDMWQAADCTCGLARALSSLPTPPEEAKA